jgi:hypothetical protein
MLAFEDPMKVSDCLGPFAQPYSKWHSGLCELRNLP